MPGGWSPENGCLTCLVGIGMILLAVAFWAYIYWRNEPTLHTAEKAAPGAATPTPAPSPAGPKPGFAPRTEKNQ